MLRGARSYPFKPQRRPFQKSLRVRGPMERHMVFSKARLISIMWLVRVESNEHAPSEREGQAQGRAMQSVVNGKSQGLR